MLQDKKLPNLQDKYYGEELKEKIKTKKVKKGRVAKKKKVKAKAKTKK